MFLRGLLPSCSSSSPSESGSLALFRGPDESLLSRVAAAFALNLEHDDNAECTPVAALVRAAKISVTEWVEGELSGYSLAYSANTEVRIASAVSLKEGFKSQELTDASKDPCWTPGQVCRHSACS